MNWIKKHWIGFTQRLYGVSVNLDRAAQEVLLGKGMDYTISGVAGSDPKLNGLRVVLDKTLPKGIHGAHSEDAAYYDQKQQEALNQAGQNNYVD